MFRRWSRYLLLLALLPLVGCYLASGERVHTTTPDVPGRGEYEVQFVSADGDAQRDITIGGPLALMILEVTVTAERGELTLQILDSTRATVLTVSGRYGVVGRGEVVVRTDDGGQVHFRILANETRKGTYTIRYRPVPPPTATPSPSPTP